jgi:hypothetical protein
MMLTVRTKLVPYELVAAKGAGGMGEVYRARDPRLDGTAILRLRTILRPLLCR